MTEPKEKKVWTVKVAYQLATKSYAARPRVYQVCMNSPSQAVSLAMRTAYKLRPKGKRITSWHVAVSLTGKSSTAKKIIEHVE